MKPEDIGQSVTPAQLREVIEKEYYETCIAATHRQGKETTNKALDKIINEVLEIEQAVIADERYELAAVCRDTCAELVLNRDLIISDNIKLES